MPDEQRFLNQDLVLRVSPSVDPGRFDISRYEPFIDALCGTREYQKEAIRVVLRYFLAGRYGSLRQLAEENFLSNEKLRKRYGTLTGVERYLQLPDQVSCAVDLATATGKSYVMYGIARIMLAHGAVDRVLVLCPSLTIEQGLLDKFRNLSADPTFKDLLPDDSRVRNPHIITGNESVVEGTVCVENFHATLEHVGSSIRDTLAGKGERTLVLNDEAHHVYNETGRDMKRWKEFLLDPDFGFRFVAGFSGTCYVGDDYFADVVSRYSLRRAIEQGYAKTIEYVAEDTSTSQDEKFQKIYDNHVQKGTVQYRKVKPLTILVTRDISACERLTDDLVVFLTQQERLDPQDAVKKVLTVTSSPRHNADLRKLPDVDRSDNPVEWITSVSMLTEGWDVQNVFQIVPHEERAFNSKLLIAQVLGRGLRIPDAYRGERPIVTVFNHDAWSSRIKHLVDEVMEVEKRVYSYPVAKSPDYNFTLHQIAYDKTQELETFEQKEEYEFAKGYVTLVSQLAIKESQTTYARATTDERRSKKTLVRYQMFTVDEVAGHIHGKLKAIDTEKATNYAGKYSLDWLRALIRKSLEKVGTSGDLVSDENRQSLQKAFGVIHREAAHTVRYRMTPRAVTTISTADRHRNSVGVGTLRRGEATVFLDEYSLALSTEEERVVLQEVLGDEMMPRLASDRVDNSFCFKTPLNVIIADHKPERLFIRQLVRPDNAAVVDGWIKSTDQDFYSIEYAWRYGEHVKRGFFNPDFFIKAGDHTVVVEVKDDDELTEPSDENQAKYRAASQHFRTLNAQQEERTYHFHFLTPVSYDIFFQYLRDRNLTFVSTLDAALAENGGG